MIIPLGTSRTIITSVGKVEKVCCPFYSTIPLEATDVIKLDVGYLSPANESTGHIYQLQYGSGDMDFVGSNPNTECLKVELEVIDSQNFKICKTFLVTSPSDTWLSQSFGNNANFLDEGGEGNLILDVHTGIDNEGQCVIPMKINACSNVSFNEPSYNGTNLGMSFQINCPANASYVVGFYEETGISNGEEITSDLNLSLTDTYGNTFENIPNNCILNPTNIYESGGVYQGTFEIDQSCLQNGRCYRSYVAIQCSDGCFTCVSPQIKTGNIKPAIVGDIVCSLIDCFGDTHISEGCCFGNLSSCLDWKFCLEMDAASYNQMLVDNDCQGDIVSNFVEASFGLGGASYPVVIDTSGNIKVTADVGGAIGVLEGQFNLKFEVGDHFDFITIPIDVSFTDSKQKIDAPTLTIEGEEVGDVICFESGGVLEFEKGNCKAFLTLDGNVLAGITDGIDTSQLTQSLCYCIKLVCPPEPEEDDCICPPCDCPDLAILFEQEGSGDLLVQPQGFTDFILNGVQYSGQANFPNPNSPFAYNIEVSLNGCHYEALGEIVLSGPITIQLVDLVFISCDDEDCDCPEDPDCDNTPKINVECDEETGEINVSFDASGINSPIASEDRNGEGVSQGEAEVSWYIEFSDGCPPISLIDNIVCGSSVCENYLSIQCSVVDCVFDLQFSPNYQDTPLVEEIYVSLDGGATYQSYDINTWSPITLDTCEEEIWYYPNVTFENGCKICFDPVQCNYGLTPLEECDYSSYGLTCAYEAGEENEDGSCNIGEFTVTPSGDQSALIRNELIWCLNDKPFKIDQGEYVPNGMPYLKPVQGDGQFNVGWLIQIRGCEPTIIWDYCGSLTLSNVNIKNQLDIEIPDTIDINIIPNCCWDGEITCDGCKLTLEGSLTNNGDDVDYEVIWCNPDGVEIGEGDCIDLKTLSDELHIDGIYTAKISSCVCGEEAIEEAYEYDRPDAGTTDNDEENPVTL